MIKRLLQILAFAGVLAFSAVYAADDDKVNINTADATTMATKLVDIGPKRAEAIVEYRTKEGAFKNIGELVNVKGIGQGILKKNIDLITVGDVKEEDAKTDGTEKKPQATADNEEKSDKDDETPADNKTDQAEKK